MGNVCIWCDACIRVCLSIPVCMMSIQCCAFLHWHLVAVFWSEWHHVPFLLLFIRFGKWHIFINITATLACIYCSHVPNTACCISYAYLTQCTARSCGLVDTFLVALSYGSGVFYVHSCHTAASRLHWSALRLTYILCNFSWDAFHTHAMCILPAKHVQWNLDAVNMSIINYSTLKK